MRKVIAIGAIYFSLIMSFAFASGELEIRFYLFYALLAPVVFVTRDQGKPLAILLTFNALAFLGAFVFSDYNPGFRFLTGSAAMLVAYITFCYGLYLSNNGLLPFVARHVVLAGCVASIVALLQICSSATILQPLHDLVDPTLLSGALSNAPYGYSQSEDLVRGQAYFREPAHLAFYLIPSLIISFSDRKLRKQALLIALAFLSTFSVSALIVLIVCGLVLALSDRRARTYVPMVFTTGIGLLISLYSLSTSVRVRIDSIADVSSAGRFVYTPYSTSFEALLAGLGTIYYVITASIPSAIFGAGRGNFSFPYEEFMEHDEQKINSMPGFNDGGNLCSLIITENGIIGVVFLLIPVYFLLREYVRLADEPPDADGQLQLKRSVFISAFILLTYNYARYGGFSFVIVWLFLGMAYGQRRSCAHA